MTQLFTRYFNFATICASVFAITIVSCSIAIGQESVPEALRYQMKAIDGDEVSLSKYAGKVVVFVNVASQCGFTSQYKQLQELHANYADQGVAIVGIPSNQFGGQEPGSADEILEFCQKNFGVEFDLMSKVDVKGDKQIGLYQHLTGLELSPQGKGPVRWNFEKFILDKNGKPIARFGSSVRPDSEQFMSVIKTALKSDQTPSTDSVKPYAHKSKKLNRDYYLFSKQVPLKNSEKTSTIYFFSKDPSSEKGNPVASVPQGKIVSETKTGMLVLKNKEGRR